MIVKFNQQDVTCNSVSVSYIEQGEPNIGISIFKNQDDSFYKTLLNVSTITVVDYRKREFSYSVIPESGSFSVNYTDTLSTITISFELAE